MNKIQSYKIEATLLCTLPIKVVYHIHADSEEEAIEEIKTIGHKMIPSEVDLCCSSVDEKPHLLLQRRVCKILYR